MAGTQYGRRRTAIRQVPQIGSRHACFPSCSKLLYAAVIPARRTSSCLLLGIEIVFLRSRGRPPKEFRHRPKKISSFSLVTGQLQLCLLLNGLVSGRTDSNTKLWLACIASRLRVVQAHYRHYTILAKMVDQARRSSFGLNRYMRILLLLRFGRDFKG